MNKFEISGEQNAVIQSQLSIARDKTTGQEQFRKAMRAITDHALLVACKDLPTKSVMLEIPVRTSEDEAIVENFDMVMGEKVLLVPVLRAGVSGLSKNMVELTGGRVAFIGLHRNPKSAMLPPVQYYNDVSKCVDKDCRVFVIDPALATGNSVIAVLEILAKQGYEKMHVVSTFSAPEGIAAINKQFPNVKITTACMCYATNARKFIIPAAGDAGDRFFGAGRDGMGQFSKDLAEIATEKQHADIMVRLSEVYK